MSPNTTVLTPEPSTQCAVDRLQTPWRIQVQADKIHKSLVYFSARLNAVSNEKYQTPTGRCQPRLQQM